jgi:hypothetical protein
LAVKVDRLYILCGFAWIVASMVFGFYIGAAEQLQYSNTHAHAALLGFVLSILFGLIYRSWPRLLESRLAPVQFGLYQVGTVVLIAGKYSIDGGNSAIMLAVLGATITIVATALMGWLFVFHGEDR